MAGGSSNNIDNVVPRQKKAEETATAAPATTDRVLLSWRAPSFDYFEKNTWWYVAAGAVVILIIGYFVWIHDWFSLAIAVIISVVLFWYVATARPKNESYAITSYGVQADDRYFPYTDMHSFSILYTERVKKVYFVFLKKYLPTLAIDISSIDPNQLRLILSRKIPENPGAGENILDRVIRLLRI
jgi:hypothetical protein